jgi:putative ABC transport system permease protein
MPGVDSVGTTTALPLSRVEAASSFTLEGHPVANAADLPLANWRVVSPEYFHVLSIPVLQGRAFTEHDNQNAPKVVVVNQSLARSFFANENPLGKRLVIGSDKAASEIVGVVGDVRHSGLDADFKPEIYGNSFQTVRPNYTLVVRTQSDPSSMVAAVRNQVQSIDKDQPVYSVKTMKELRSEALAELRFNTLMLTLFAAIALLLAAVGIYGVISYSTARRTHEIGVRMALGAQPSNVLKLILGQGMTLAVLGIVIGLAASFALTRVLTTLLYSVSPTDPLTFVFVSILLALVALLASYIPARRATRVDPTIALRYE